MSYCTSLVYVAFFLCYQASCSAVAGLNFLHQGSTVTVGSGKLILNTAITGWNGTLAQTGAVVGQPITFTNGIVTINNNPAWANCLYAGNAATPFVLNTNQLLRVSDGLFSSAVVVIRNGNRLEGTPDFSLATPLTLAHNLSSVTLAINGNMGSIAMNGGTIILDNDLDLLPDATLTGSGTVDTAGRRFIFGAGLSSGALLLTHTLLWNDASQLQLNGNVVLYGMWRFGTLANANCDPTISGNGHTLDLSRGSSIFIKANTMLRLVDVKIKGLGRGGFVFEDHTSQLRLSRVEIEMANSYTVTTGGIVVNGESTIVTKNHVLTMSTNASLTVDGVTLWYDTTQYVTDYAIQPLQNAASNVNNKFVTYSNGGAVQGMTPLVLAAANSNTLLYLNKNNSNTILYNARITSNALLSANRTHSSYALYVNRTLSNTILYNARTTSNAILSANRTSSSYALYVNRTNSNTILYNARTTSNAILSANRTSSSYALYVNRTLSNADLYNNRTASNALLSLKRTTSSYELYVNRTLSNTILYNYRINSNAILSANRTSSSYALYVNRTLSNTILYNNRTTSNALLFGNRVNSNAIVTAPAVQPFTIFPTGVSTNIIFPFQFFEKGFVLQDSNTTCTFGSVFPVSGFVSLHGGQLYLGTDLIFQNVTNWGTCGTIIANNHAVDFSSTITGMTMTNNMVLNNANIYLNNDITLSGTAKFTGNCVLDARGCSISLGSNASIVVGHNASLRLRNVDLNSVTSGRIQCLDNSAKLILDNMQWTQTGNYTFTQGSIEFDNQVHFVGPYTFVYASSLTSTIDTESMWYLSDVINVTIGRTGGIFSREPLYFTDQTAKLKLENCTFTVTSSGMSLLNGAVVIDREVYIDINSTSTSNGLLVGNGNSANDPYIYLYPDAAINLASGYLVSNVTRSSTFASHDVPVNYVQSGNSVIYDKHSTNYSNINVSELGSGGSILAPGTSMYYTNANVTLPTAEFTVTATRFTAQTLLLFNGGTVKATFGTYPLASLIEGTGNTIASIGDISGPIIFSGLSPAATLDVGGSILSNISLNGGTITLGNDLTLGYGIVITGGGFLQLASHTLNLNLGTTTWTSTMLFNGNGAFIKLNDATNLAAPLFVEGSCIIDGQGNTLSLATAGSITVKQNATLRFKNIFLNKVGGSNICCQDNSGSIIFDTTAWIQDANFTFSNGSFGVVHSFDMIGSYTFAFNTSLASTIHSNSTLSLDQAFTFSYDPQGNRPQLLTFLNNSSQLYMNNATIHATKYGMQLTNGTLLVDGLAQIFVEGAQAVTGLLNVGSSQTAGFVLGNNAGNDQILVLNFGATLEMDRGYLIYQNVNASSLFARSQYSNITINPGADLLLEQPMNLSPGILNLSTSGGLINQQYLNGSVSQF